jgi:hypothetical protein
MATSPRLEDLPGSSLEAEFGGTGGGVRESPIAQATGSAAAPTVTGSQSAPAKAPAAPGKTNDVFTGLCEALNTFQKRLADPKDPKRKYDVPDEYDIVFAPDSMADHTLKRQGTTDKSNVPMQKPSAQAKSPASNSVNNKATTRPVTAGTQIIQFIDQVMRESSYITDQQLYIVDPVADPVTGLQKTMPNPNPSGGTVAWYKVSVEAIQLEYDAKRHDHAYRMTYIITPYAINSLPSDYFKNSRYRGSHKSYNYWFTGLNKEILNFEQEYNNLYRLVISGLNVPVQQARTDFRDQYRRTFLPTSENHAKGADGNTNEAGDNAASFLYSPTDQAKVRLRIVGDPAWMQQGEVAAGVSVANFNFSPFNDDGTINYDSQEVVFDISWNQPTDYDFNTGLMEINNTGVKPGGKPRTQPQLNFTYTAIKCKNIFSKGRFEQDLEGRLLIEYEKNSTPAAVVDAGRPAATVTSAKVPTPAQVRAADTSIAAGILADTRGSTTGLEFGGNDEVLLATGTAVVTPNQSDSAPQPRPAPAPKPPTSSGDLEFGAFSGALDVIAPPLNASAASATVQDSVTIQQIQAAIARNRELIAIAAPGSLASTRLQQQNRDLESTLNNLGQAGSVAPGVRTTPQLENRET